MYIFFKTLLIVVILVVFVFGGLYMLVKRLTDRGFDHRKVVTRILVFTGLNIIPMISFLVYLSTRGEEFSEILIWTQAFCFMMFTISIASALIDSIFLIGINIALFLMFIIGVEEGAHLVGWHQMIGTITIRFPYSWHWLEWLCSGCSITASVVSGLFFRAWNVYS